MLGDPACRRVAILCRCREAVFGRMPVTDAEEDHPGTPAQVTAERIVGLLVTQHPAAAMEIDHDRMWPRRRRPIQTVGQRTVSARECAVDNLADWPSGRTAFVELIDEVPGALGAKRLDRRQIHFPPHPPPQPHNPLPTNTP